MGGKPQHPVRSVRLFECPQHCVKLREHVVRNAHLGCVLSGALYDNPLTVDFAFVARAAAQTRTQRNRDAFAAFMAELTGFRSTFSVLGHTRFSYIARRCGAGMTTIRGSGWAYF